MQNEATLIRFGHEDVGSVTWDAGGGDVFEDVFVGRCRQGMITFGL